MMVGGFSFYQRAEVKDLLAYLKVGALAAGFHQPAAHRSIRRRAASARPRSSRSSSTPCSTTSACGTRSARMIDEEHFGTRARAALQVFPNTMRGTGRRRRRRGRWTEALEFILDRTGYRKMLEHEPIAEAETRRGESERTGERGGGSGRTRRNGDRFLDHAALVSDADSARRERRRSSLLTMHNAKGLEFPVVFIGGHGRGAVSAQPVPRLRDAQLEEERRLCYVGMTRAEKRLYLTWAVSRRRCGGGPAGAGHPFALPQRSAARTSSRRSGTERRPDRAGGPDAERSDVYAGGPSQYVYTGKTYNSLENISQFFTDRGIKPPSAVRRRPARAPKPPAVQASRPCGRDERISAADQFAGEAGNQAPAMARAGRFGPARSRASEVRARHGIAPRRRRRDAKITVSFPGYGLKKLVEKYAGMKTD